jgi:UDP-N-acetyl-2-amino-2-deoxyglucuronate dehydrogenase
MLHFAIIGCGRIAIRHAENIIRIGKLIAVCDIDKDKALSFASKFGSRAYTSLDELLTKEPDITVVCICTPNGYHAQHCIQSLESGRNVLCEKPLCLTTRDAQNIIEAEKKSRKKLFVVKSMRFNPLVKSLKEIINTGKLGKIYSFHLSCFWNRPKEYFNGWHGKKTLDGGTLFTQFSHYIDAMLWLFGSIEKASGYIKNVAHDNAIEFEDTGVASLYFQKDILGSLHWSINTYLKNFEIALTVIAEKGTIALDGEFLNKIKYQHIESNKLLEAVKDVSNRDSLSRHAEVYDELKLSLESEGHTIINSLDGLKTVEAIEMIYSSTSKN